MKNGWIIKTLVGFLFTISYGAITLIGTNLIANEKESRHRDETISRDLADHKLKAETRFHEYAMRQETTNGEILKTLAVIQNDIEHIRDGTQ